MSFTLIIAFVLSFLLGFLGLDHFLKRCGVNERLSFAFSTLFGILVAVFATIAVAPLVHA